MNFIINYPLECTMKIKRLRHNTAIGYTLSKLFYAVIAACFANRIANSFANR